MAELTRTALTIERDLLARFDAWAESHGYANRSQAVREVLRAAVIEAEWGNPAAQVTATLSIVYDHASRSLAQELTSLQHEDHDVILCSQHVHLDRHRCMEVIIMRGMAKQLRRVSDAIIGTRGVRAGKLAMMSPSV